jgi:hypothetical protein
MRRPFICGNRVYFELMKAISASISISDKFRFGICVSDFTDDGSFNLSRNASGLAVKLERLVAPISMVQYSKLLAALLL